MDYGLTTRPGKRAGASSKLRYSADRESLSIGLDGLLLQQWLPLLIV